MWNETANVAEKTDCGNQESSSNGPIATDQHPWAHQEVMILARKPG